MSAAVRLICLSLDQYKLDLELLFMRHTVANLSDIGVLWQEHRDFTFPFHRYIYNSRYEGARTLHKAAYGGTILPSNRRNNYGSVCFRFVAL